MPISRRSSDEEAVQAPAQPPLLKGSEPPHQTRVVAHIAYTGVKPKDIPVADIVTLLRAVENDDNVDHVYRNRIKGRLSAVRAFCVFCQGGSPKAARLCANVTCPLWSFRTGSNGMRGERK